jgi:hypothetical protein
MGVPETPPFEPSECSGGVLVLANEYGTPPGALADTVRIRTLAFFELGHSQFFMVPESGPSGQYYLAMAS